jgi:uncharacterized protein YsxB (DUF464 family)
MICVYYNERSLKIVGHSNEVVCAGVSAIAQTAVLGLKNVVGLKFEEERDTDTGLLAFKLPKMSLVQEHDAEVIMKTLIEGLKDLKKSFKKQITIKEER